MSEGTFLTLYFAQIFRFFYLESPFFGLTFGQILFGMFICEMGVGIFADIFLSFFSTDTSKDKTSEAKRYSYSHRSR